MRVGVDEAGEYKVSGGVQLLGAGRAGELAPHSHDLIGVDEHVGGFQSRLRAVHHLSATNQ